MEYSSTTKDLSLEALNCRIKLDFQKRISDILPLIEEFYPQVTPEQIAAWEENKALESLVIEGEKRYFNRAARNLFRIDAEARNRYLAKYADDRAKRTAMLSHFIPKLIEQTTQQETTQGSPTHYTIEFTLTVQPNAVPDGEIIRCWLPFAQRNHRRQHNVNLLYCNVEKFSITETNIHATIYMEQAAVADLPTLFTIRLSFSCIPEYLSLETATIVPYPVVCPEVALYCQEQLPHICFSDAVRTLSKQIIGEEKNPYLKAKRIFTWISENIPWASAREYSTIECIPDYVIDNRHGDCGQVTLLFISLCRLNGIPARWQSGFMLHPGYENLHDWAEIYFHNIGWVSVDQSFGIQTWSNKENERYFYLGSQDSFRWIVNSGISAPLIPSKKYPRSETVDFQRGEVEWQGGNLYFDKWSYKFHVIESFL